MKLSFTKQTCTIWAKIWKYLFRKNAIYFFHADTEQYQGVLVKYICRDKLQRSFLQLSGTLEVGRKVQLIVRDVCKCTHAFTYIHTYVHTWYRLVSINVCVVVVIFHWLSFSQEYDGAGWCRPRQWCLVGAPGYMHGSAFVCEVTAQVRQASCPRPSQS